MARAAQWMALTMHRTPGLPRRALALGGALLLALTLASAALGQSAPRLQGQVTDQTGSLGGGAASVQSALDALLNAQGVQLYVAFVSTSGGVTAQELAQETYTQNGLGGNDMVLLVAVSDRRYGYYQDGALGSLTATDVNALLSSTLEPRFRAGDYAGGIVAFANGLGRAMAGGAVPGAAGQGGAAPGGPSTGGASSGGTSSGPGSGLLVILVGLVIVVLGVALVGGWVRRWRTAHLAAEERDRRTGQLARQANQLLIQADDSVRDAVQDLGFAEAEFSAEDVEPFRAALSAARDELKAAFAVRQQLDDAIPEDPPTREKMLNEIVARAGRVGEIIGAQRQRFGELRDLEHRAPEILAGLPGQAAALAARLPSAEAAEAGLAAYADACRGPVSGNLAEARKRIDFATAAASRGQAALAATPPDPHAARDAARAGQAALAQAGSLLDAIDHLVASVEEARGRVQPEIAEAEADIAAARAALQRGVGDPSLGTALSEAEARLAAARGVLAAARPDPLAALKGAQEAHAAADRVLASERAAEEQLARQRAALQTALASAQASVTHAADYIGDRRNGVGREARTRLAEAQRHMEQAQSAAGTDPAIALTEAQQAQRLADDAYRIASSDFDAWNGRGGPRAPRAVDPTGAIIGGIILGSLLGGGRHGGGWGGTPWGGGGFGGFGRGGGGFGGGGSW